MIYHATINWWDDIDGEDIITHTFISANDFNDAVYAINQRFTHINSIDIDKVNSDKYGIVCVPNASAAEIAELNKW